jgi:uncharacterized protein with beta-barrel porin domain
MAINATDVRNRAWFSLRRADARLWQAVGALQRVAWAHDFVSNPALSAAFQTLPGGNFTVFGASLPRGSRLTTAGAQLYLTPQWTLIVKFDGEFANGSHTYGGAGALRYTW